ncbi:MAG: 1-phosphofructokinase [Lachnospiraceae bacterium]|uniref:Tagatose-6-phosphate kinase n=1 Tax=Candidatus Weimeria bifida TaxID=2599074 RepID=A0A6N7J217_9FIRM|nr:1-phosphofructokinase [Candidatus Weimeria bifida]RRF96778.1 MAG: 1-phosphofructokinase [Lachnospiraceae bacterium]
MIMTVTFNPSLDYIISVDDFKLGLVNRTSKELLLPGGKGLNVSMVLKNLGTDSTAVGFMAGFTGKAIRGLMSEKGIDTDFIEVEEGISRINVKIRDDKDEETGINGMGPAISKKNIEALYQKFDELKKDDYLVLAGSIPTVMPETMYRDIMKYLEGRGVHIIVDATRDLLKDVLPYHPFLVKPNNYELGEIFGVEINTVDEVVPYAKKMQEMGAENVLVSMAGEGALLVSADGDVISSKPPKGRLKNSVGAGDSMVAGFLNGYIGSGDYEKAFYMGLCTGSASAFSDYLATKDEVKALLEQIGKGGIL